MNYKFSNLIEVAKVQRLNDLFYTATGIPGAVIDLKGTIVTCSGWQEVCTKFHRVNAGTVHRCVESDTVFANQIGVGEKYTVYKCGNGLVVAAIPIAIGGERVANFITSQFLFHPPDRDSFLEQGRRFGFDEAAYMEAVGKIPVIDESKLPPLLEYFSEFAAMLGEMGLKQLRQLEAAAALRESEQCWATTLSSIGDAVMATDKDGGITFMNPVAERLTGWTLTEAAAKPIAEVFNIINERTRKAVDNPITKALQKRMIVGLANHTVLISKDGREIPIDDSAAPIRDAAGNTMGVVLVFRDITEGKAAEQALRESQTQMNRAQEIAHLGSWELDLMNNRISWSDEVYRIFGLQPQEFGATYEAFLEAVHPEDREAVDAAYSGSLREGRDTYEIEHRVVRRSSGEIRIVHEKCEHFRDETGRIVKSVGMVHDITERKAAEQALRKAQTAVEEKVKEILLELEERKRAEEALSESKERFRSVLENSRDVIYRLNMQTGRYEYISPSIQNVIGYSPDELLAMDVETALAMIHPEDLPAMHAAVASLEESGEAEIEYRQRIKSGEYIWISNRMSLTKESAGRPLYRYGNYRDVTDRRQAEQELREARAELERKVAERTAELQRSEAYLAEAQRLSHIGSWAFDLASGKFVYASEECIRMYEHDAQEGLPTREVTFRLIHPEDRDSVQGGFEKSLREKVDTSSEFRLVLPSGTVKHVQAIRHPVLNDAGEVVQLVGTTIDITERKQAEDRLRHTAEALRRSEAYLAEAQRLSHTGSWAFDLASDKYVYASEECCRIFEFDPQEGLPTREAFARQIHPEFYDKVHGEYEKSLREKVDTSIEFRVALPSGAAKYIQAIQHPVLNEAGDVVELMGTAIDITERKRAEEALRLAGVYNRSLIEASLDPLVTIDKQGKISDINGATEQVTGYPRSELIGTDFSDYFTEPEKARAGYQQVFNQGFVRDYELEIRNRNGEITPVLYNASVYRDDKGNVIGVFAAARDITKQKRAEEARSRLAAIVESSDDAIISKDLDGMITSWNGGAERLYGYSASEALGRDVFTETPPDQRDEIAVLLRQIREGIRIEHYETERVRKDGRRINVALTLSLVKTPQGKIIGASSIARDITERKRAEAEINSLKNYLSNIIDSMPSILVGMDNARTVTQWNRQAEAFTGIPAGEAIGKPIAGLLPDFAPWITTMGSDMDEHRPSSMEKLLIEKEGERRFYDLMLYPLLVDSVGGAVLRIEDVTERARIEELMVQTEKMMSVGGLAAGMAHEINNPLGIITQAAQNIERRISLELPANRKVSEELGVNLEGIRAYFDKRQISDAIASIRTASSRAAKIVGNMLQFSRRADTTMELTSLAQIVDEALELAASDYDLKKNYDFRSINIIKDYQDIPQVRIVSVEIEQVILNLLKNAAQAMTATPPDTKPRITLRLRCEDRYAVLEVEDNGPGMTEDIRRRVFEPFFTTKEPRVGTGLGLSVSYMIVTQNHKGLMEVQSTPGRGTVFNMRLPIAGEQT